MIWNQEIADPTADSRPYRFAVSWYLIDL